MIKPQHLKLERIHPNEWAFNCPPQWEFLGSKLERARNAEQAGDDEGAAVIYLELIESCPEYLPALNNLGLLYQRQGELDKAISILEIAVALGLACIPDEFEAGKDQIPWHWEDNRAFLLAHENLGKCHIEQSLDVFEHLLEINKGYHGVSNLVSQLRRICNGEYENTA